MNFLKIYRYDSYLFQWQGRLRGFFLSAEAAISGRIELPDGSRPWIQITTLKELIAGFYRGFLAEIFLLGTAAERVS